jgi:hypothetical protein
MATIIRQVGFAGSNGVGVVSAQGALAGDRLVSVVSLTTMQDFLSGFAIFVPANATVLQTSGSDLSVDKFIALIERTE